MMSEISTACGINRRCDIAAYARAPRTVAAQLAAIKDAIPKAEDMEGLIVDLVRAKRDRLEPTPVLMEIA